MINTSHYKYTTMKNFKKYNFVLMQLCTLYKS